MLLRRDSLLNNSATSALYKSYIQTANWMKIYKLSSDKHCMTINVLFAGINLKWQKLDLYVT